MSLILHIKPDCPHCDAAEKMAEECILLYRTLAYDTPEAVLNFEASGRQFPYIEREVGALIFPIGGMRELEAHIAALILDSL